MDMVKDPICGMKIDPVKAEEAGLVIEADGKTYYFCSEECAEEFHRHGLPHDRITRGKSGNRCHAKT